MTADKFYQMISECKKDKGICPHALALENLEDEARTQEAQSSKNAALRDLKLLKSGDYSDFTITCEGESFKVHRAIICPRSPFFAAAASGGFVVSPSYLIFDETQLLI